jgi:hypothetical protein
VLSLVAFNPEPTQLKDIGLKLGLNRSMVSRIVADLIAGGLLVKVAYRSVIGTPALAALGRSAGKNHPLSRIAREVLHQPMAELGLTCEFATLVPGGLFHFYQLRRNTPPYDPFWRSDTAASILAAAGEEWEKELEELAPALPEKSDDALFAFKERVLAAKENRSLINRHAGRFWQLTLPVSCGSVPCALSAAGTINADLDKMFFECSKLAARITALYGDYSDRDA